MAPIALGNSIVRINYLIDKAVASGLGAGGISALAYGQTLDQFVIVIIINSISSVMFAHFANLVAKNEQGKITTILDNTISALSLALIPATIITIVEAKNIVSIIYGRGNFGDDAVLLASIALQGYAIRYAFVGIRDVTIQGLYAYKEVKKPMLNSVVSTIVNIIVSVAFVEKIGILSIALGTSASAIVGTVLNVRSFKKISNYGYSVIKRIALKSIPGILIGALSSLIISYNLNLPPLLELVIVTILVFVIYYITLILLESEEFFTISGKLMASLRKTARKLKRK